MSGHHVSHANNKVKRVFYPNLHKKRFWLPSEKRHITLRVSAQGIRYIDKVGVEAAVQKMRANGVRI